MKKLFSIYLLLLLITCLALSTVFSNNNLQTRTTICQKGTVQISNGYVVVSSACILNSSQVLITRKDSSFTPPFVVYSFGNVLEGTSFTIHSTDNMDNGQVAYIVVN